jgi:carbonic anhydrase/acetyltransferase-like protein (isoleucine patch superfamily)
MLEEGEQVMIGNQAHVHAGEKVESKPLPGVKAKWSTPNGK